MAQPAPAPQGDEKKIIVNSDGTIPLVELNNGGVGKFEVSYPANTNTCTITCTATFTQTDKEDDYTVSLSS
jgi:hypothetical protein